MASRFGQPVSRLREYSRRHTIALLISLAVAILSVGLYVEVYLFPHPSPLFQFLADFEMKSLDMRLQLRGAEKPDPHLAIVAIDQKSEDVLGRWPFPRKYLAETVDRLREAGARVIAFDINFPQPDQNSSLEALNELQKTMGETARRSPADRAIVEELDRLRAQADNDRQFADALARHPNVILGYFFMPASEARNQDTQRVKEFTDFLSFQTYTWITHPEYARLFEGKEFAALSPNLPQFAQPAKNFGYFNVFPDPNGTVRREPVVVRYQGNFYPSLDIASVLAYRNLSLDRVNIVFNENGLEHIELGSRVIPTDPEGFVQIDYRGPARTYPTYSLSDVVRGNTPPEAFRDRLVLVGPTATGIGDMAVTPFQKMGFPGVEVHANFIDNVLSGTFIRRGLRENGLDLVFIILFSLGSGVVLTTLSPWRATFIILGVFALYLAVADVLFATERIWIALFLPSATLVVNYAAVIGYRSLFEEREKKKVRAAFQQYLPPGLINQLLTRPELLQLGGEEKVLTVMFSDIRNFTALSEGLRPAELVDLLNEYLSEMTDVIFRNWGTLDKYIGDAIMAFWGAPYPQDDHPERACRSALEMSQALTKLTARWIVQGRPPIDIGVGIHTGAVLVGNMGSSKRFNFTILGDNVNLASRLEGLNKQFGTRIILSEVTYEQVRERVVAREIDLIRVKGKTQPVRIFELLGPGESAAVHFDLVRRFGEGLQAYRNAQWETAARAFEGLTRDYPDDGPSRTFLERCRDLLEQPPEGAWDGVYVMKTK